ncbi:MAG: hypothetical protein ACRDNL_06790, partial [Spirillospora sp.]
MTPPAEQSAVHDEQAGAGPGRGIDGSPPPGEDAAPETDARDEAADQADQADLAVQADDEDEKPAGTSGKAQAQAARRGRYARRAKAPQPASDTPLSDDDEQPPQDAKPDSEPEGQSARRARDAQPAARRAARPGKRTRQGRHAKSRDTSDTSPPPATNPAKPTSHQPDEAEPANAQPDEEPPPAKDTQPAKDDKRTGTGTGTGSGRGRRRVTKPSNGANTVRQSELTQAITSLRDQLGAFNFLLDVPGVQEAREARDELRDQLQDYVLPRIHAAGAPMLVVLGGSTGAGKSTLVNTLVGARVSATGVLRPTTSSPILVCHPDHAQWFLEGPLLPGMGRVRGPAPDAIAGDQLVIITSDVLPPGLALLDSPDFDSVFEDHYEFATKLMAAADLWLCVTTAARYADAQVWQMLQRAKENGATIGVVLSRVPQGAGPQGAEIVEHFGEMLDDNEVGDARRFTIPETRIEDSRLPEETVEDLRAWLTGVAEDAEDREIVISDTLAAVLDSYRTRVPELARQVEAQVEQRGELAGEVEAGYGTALAELDEATRNGSLLRGEVLARWQDFAGTGDLLRSLHAQRSRRG